MIIVMLIVLLGHTKFNHNNKQKLDTQVHELLVLYLWRRLHDWHRDYQVNVQKDLTSYAVIYRFILYIVESWDLVFFFSFCTYKTLDLFYMIPFENYISCRHAFDVNFSKVSFDLNLGGRTLKVGFKIHFFPSQIFSFGKFQTIT